MKWQSSTYTALTMRFHMHPLNGMLALLEVCSTSAGIPPRKIRCKFNGWSLGSKPFILASSSTWITKDLVENKRQIHRNYMDYMVQNKMSSELLKSLQGALQYIGFKRPNQNTDLPASLSMRSECSLPSFSVPWSGRLMTGRGL